MIPVFHTVSDIDLDSSTDVKNVFTVWTLDRKSSGEGTAVALLGVALEMIGRGTYQAPTSLTPTSPTSPLTD